MTFSIRICRVVTTPSLIEILVSVPVVPLGPARPAPVVVGGDGEGHDHGDGGAQANPPQHVQAPPYTL